MKNKDRELEEKHRLLQEGKIIPFKTIDEAVTAIKSRVKPVCTRTALWYGVITDRLEVYQKRDSGELYFALIG